MASKGSTKWMNLVIVESPAKSKTIKKYLGEGFEVKASFGHVVDLPRKNMGIDIEHNFRPSYEVSPEKKKIIAELKKLAKQAEKVRIATDEDREWEAIGWHVANQLKLDIDKTSRIVFHEITKTAIEKAIQNPRTLDMHLVDAQQARRVLDRLVWFELSPVLRRKIKPGLSAWRVQSVAVRLIVERERAIQAFESQAEFKITGSFVWESKRPFEAELNKKIAKESEVKNLLDNIKDANFSISKIEIKPAKKSPSAPFTTSTLQQEASRKMGYPVAKTMQLAQKLYEAGYITYMRTDSLNMSQLAIDAAKKVISSQFGAEYSQPTVYKVKSKGAQEAHECIRPTDMSKTMLGADAQQKKLYDLIRKRALSSQMAPAKLEKTKATIDISGVKEKFLAQGEVIKFDGFLKLYLESKDDGDEEETKGTLPKLKEGETVQRETIIAKQVFSKHPPRFTEASLVKELEKQGIGRPSTYAPTISTIQKRGYIIKENRDGVIRDYKTFTLKESKITEETQKQTTWAEKQKLFPTDIGIIVNDFLVKHFENIMNYGFTASVEEQFDHVATGKTKRYNMIKGFYTPFHKLVTDTLGDKEFVKTERSLGKDPKTGKAIIARMGRYGPLVQLGEKDENTGEKPKFAPIPRDKTIETISLEDALQCFTLPRNLGEYEGKELLVNIGRFGPYVKRGTMFASLQKPKGDEPGDDPHSITKQRAIELVEEKKELDKNKYINEFDYEKKKIEILNGRYGPYIKYDKKNYKIPKDKDAKKLSLEDCIMLIGISKKGGTKTSKKTASSKKKKVTTKK